MSKLIPLGLSLYVLGYIIFRLANVETWDQDGLDYVIFPDGNLTVYYLFRPLTYLDGMLTAMRFHIGPHN